MAYAGYQGVTSPTRSDVERRQALADALTSQSMQPAGDFWGGLAQLGTAFAGRHAAGRVESDRSQAEQAAQQRWAGLMGGGHQPAQSDPMADIEASLMAASGPQPMQSGGLEDVLMQAQGAPAPQPMGGGVDGVADALMSQQQGPGMQDWMAASEDPWLSDSQRSIAETMYQQQMMQEMNAPMLEQRRQQAAQLVQQYAPGNEALMTAAQMDPDGVLERFLGNMEAANVSAGASRIDPITGQMVSAPTADLQTLEGLSQRPDLAGLDMQRRQAGASRTNVNLPGQPNIGSIPAGYAATQDPQTGAWSMEPVAGGPVALEQEQAAARAQQAQQNASSYARTVTEDIGTAISYLDQMTGLSGMDNPIGGITAERLANIPRTPEYNMKQFVDSALSNVTLDTINRMRETSPAGATGFGNMSERQMQVIRGVLGQWQPGLPVEDQRHILQRLSNFYMDVQFGTRAERDQAVRDGRITRGEADAYEQYYYPATRDVMGRRVEQAQDQESIDDLLQRYGG